MAVLIIGLALFLGVHSIALAAPDFRSRAIARMGARPWKGLYAAVSAAGLVLVLYGFHLARQSPVVLYTPPGWMRYVTVLLFGGFLAWAVIDRISLKRRAQTVPTVSAGRFNDLLAVVLGLALYALFIGWAHVRLFGVSPLG
jgi:uncharacterized membrane protein